MERFLLFLWLIFDFGPYFCLPFCHFFDFAELEGVNTYVRTFVSTYLSTFYLCTHHGTYAVFPPLTIFFVPHHKKHNDDNFTVTHPPGKRTKKQIVEGGRQ